MNARYPTALLCTVDAGVLIGIDPQPGRLIHRLTAPRAWLEQSPDAALATVAGTLLWFVAAWLGVGIAATLLARLPGAIGRACALAGRLLLPGALRRLVAGSVGLGALLTPVPLVLGTTAAATAHPASVAAIPAPVWPGTETAAPPASDSGPARRVVVVRPGDTLWTIAARRLGPDAEPADVAAAWPRWYAANRPRIGPDPDLIRPGQRLDPPDRAHDS